MPVSASRQATPRRASAGAPYPPSTRPISRLVRGAGRSTTRPKQRSVSRFMPPSRDAISRSNRRRTTDRTDAPSLGMGRRVAAQGAVYVAVVSHIPGGCGARPGALRRSAVLCWSLARRRNRRAWSRPHMRKCSGRCCGRSCGQVLRCFSSPWWVASPFPLSYSCPWRNSSYGLPPWRRSL